MSFKAIAAIALGLLSVGASAGGQSGEPMYYVHMYSDATHTEEVGYLTPECRLHPAYPSGYYVQYTQHGTYTQYTYDELVGYCPEDRP